MTVPTLTDGVVTLRAHRESDVEACWEQHSDPLTQEWTGVPVPYSREDARRFVRDAMPGGWALDAEWGFAVEAQDDHGTARYAGTVTLRPQDPRSGPFRAEIAYGAHPWARGRGLVERALRLLLDWGFAEHPDLERVLWHARVGNWSSRKVAWRLGFSCDGATQQASSLRGELVDSWFGSLHRGDARLPRNRWLEVPVIEGNRARLRPYRPSDVQRLLEGCSDERTAYWLGLLPSPYTAADAAVYLASRADQSARGAVLHWAVADPASDVLLGDLSVMHLDVPSGPEIGYWVHPAARGHGVMTEAVRLAVRHAFIDTADGGLGCSRLRLVAAVDNTASRQVALRAGFREVGIERAAVLCRDGAHDAMVFDRLPGDRLPGDLLPGDVAVT
ncbi:MAG: putative GCN5-related N-acetyltransferase [Marmoricola sp.]|nr:putative GCN5-related N-acetyltransferase [Marmoricola sp.]